MAEDKKTTPPKVPPPPKPQQANKKTAVVPTPTVVIKSPVDKLEELTKIDLDTLGDLDTKDLRKKMLQGIYLLEHVLFSQAGFEFKRIQKLRSLIGVVEAEIFDEAKFKLLSESEKLRLYRMMMSNMSQSLDFMSNLHKNVTLGVEAVNSIDRIKADKGFIAGAPEDVVSDEVDSIRTKILEQIASKSKDSRSRVEVVKIQAAAVVKPKPKKKKKPKPKSSIQTPTPNVPLGKQGGE